MLKTRPAVPQDVPFMFELYASTRLSEIALWGWDEKTAEAFLRMQWAAQIQAYDRQYPDLRKCVVLVDDCGAGRMLIGCKDAALVLVDLSLLPTFRGRGYGRLLIEGIQKEAAEAGKPLRLSVAVGNPAKRLYECLGFRMTGSNGMYDQMEWRGETAEVLSD